MHEQMGLDMVNWSGKGCRIGKVRVHYKTKVTYIYHVSNTRQIYTRTSDIFSSMCRLLPNFQAWLTGNFNNGSNKWVSGLQQMDLRSPMFMFTNSFSFSQRTTQKPLKKRQVLMTPERKVTLQGINGNFKVGKERTYRAVIRQVVPLRKVQSHLIKGLKPLSSMVGDAPVAAPLHTSPLVFH